MTESLPDDTVRVSLEVPASAEAAFDTFVRRFSAWYPPEYSWSGGSLAWIGIEPVVGGHCFELGPHEFRCDWGRVLAFEPPTRLLFSWQIGSDRVPVPDPLQASEIEVRWRTTGPLLTTVELTHAYFERHGRGWAEYRDAMAAPTGWPYVLERYAAAVPP